MAVGSGNTSGRIAVQFGKQIRWSQTYDTMIEALSSGMTPEGIASYLSEVDAGDIATLCQLQDEMEAKDAHLQGVAARRREALTAVEWEIEPDPKADDATKAKSAADYCQWMLDHCSTWAETLEHLATAIGPGIAVTELVWQFRPSGIRLAETNDIPGHRLVRDMQYPDIKIVTDKEPLGHAVTRGKYIVHTPNARAGFPLRVTLTRAQLYLFCLRHLGLADYASFLELYGMPLRVGKVKPEASPTERETVRNIVRDMTADSWAMLSDASDIQFLEANRGTEPFSTFIEWIENKTSILWLGQTLTTDVGSVGSFAAAKVHENVKASILLNDVANESRTIRSQLLKVLVELRWPNQSMPVPYFRRKLIQGADLEGDRLKMDKLRFCREAGIALETDVAYELLGLPRPAKEEDTNAPKPGET